MAQPSGQFNLNAMVNEYVFARAIEDYNVSVRSYNQSEGVGQDEKRPYITAREGREMHEEWMQAVASKPQRGLDASGQVGDLKDPSGQPIPCTLASITREQCRDTLMAILPKHMPHSQDWADPAYATKQQQTYFDEWAAMTGIAVDRGPARDARLKNGVQFTELNAIPCSPFDPQFAERQTMLEHGTEILYVKPESILQDSVSPTGRHTFVGTGDSIEAQHDKDLKFMQVQFMTEEKNKDGTTKQRRAEADMRTDQWSFREAGPMSTTADVAGITRLREFMDPREFMVAARWMERVPESQRMTSAMTDRSVALLEMFRDNGIPYSIKPDQNPGQLKANISNTKMSVRIADTRGAGADANQGMYIGRVYNDGNHVILRPNKVSPEIRRNYVPTIEDTKNMVLWAMGRSVMRNAVMQSLRGPVGSESAFKDSPDGTPGKRSTYFSASKTQKPQLTALFGTQRNPLEPMKNGKPNNMYLYIQTGNNHSNAHLDFPTEESAETFLQRAVETARENFEQKVNIDYLVSEAHAHEGEKDFVPFFSGDPSIAPIQLTYWNVLQGHQQLYRPQGDFSDESFDELREFLSIDDDLETDYNAEESGLSTDDKPQGVEVSMEPYDGSPEEVIRAHLRDNVDVLFGGFEPDWEGKRFSPSLVASFMESGHGTARNKDNLVAAMRKLDFTGEELRGDDFETGTIKDKLLKFNPESARPMQEIAEERAKALGCQPEQTFMGCMLDTIVSTLQQTACKIDRKDVLIDDMGVVQYRAQMMLGLQQDGFRPLIGEIGQIFEPDSDGLVETKYYGSQNKLFTPGYEGFVVPETEETKGAPLEQRYRFRGLPQILQENLQQTLRYDVQNIQETLNSDSPTYEEFHTGTTTSVNNTYNGLNKTVYKISIEPEEGESLKDTFLRQMEMTHVPHDVSVAILKTNAGMVSFNKSLVEGSSVNAEYQAQRKEARQDMIGVHELTNDNVQDAYELTHHANMAITAENSDRLFDPVVTGSGKNQGSIRYFVRGAGVNADGTPIFAPDDGTKRRAPIMETADQLYADYIPADRQQMEASNYMTASGVAGSKTELDENGQPHRGIGVAQLTLQGLTFDDGAVISKKFADTYGVIGEGGQLRPLMPGDKLCDMAGNKSIIAHVIDPEMDLEAAKAKGVDQAVLLFRNNPDLDVVQAPYSAVSRFNAAGAKLAMEHPADLVLPDGSVHAGCIGFTPMTITHHTAEDHTKSYDDDDVKRGKGRKVSTQQAWMLTAKGATAMMKEIFEPNNSATINAREYLNTLGYDMSETGEIRVGYQPHNGEERFKFDMPDDATIASLTSREISGLFTDVVGTRGGFLELPFPLMMPSGQQTAKLDPSQSSRPDRDMYMFPIMSAHLRSGQTFEDGTKNIHDYTNQYQTIYQKAVEYLAADETLKQHGSELDEKQRAALEKTLATAPRAAQQSYESITDDVWARKFDSKHNIARDELMSRRMPNSVTAVWTPNPMLGVNQIAMPESLAKTLKVEAGDRVLVNRDPLLRTYGMRDMEVVIDDSLHGVAVHPAMAVSFDGDFDGDSVGLQALKTKAARDESYRLFSFEENMLDFSRVRKNGDYALMFNDSMDIISAEAVDMERHEAQVAELKAQYGEDEAGFEAAKAALPEPLRDRRMRLEHEFNEVYRDKSLSQEERMAKNKALTTELSEYARDVMVPQVATELISYANPQEHMQSLIQIVDHGAKGSMGKLKAYMKFAGFEAPTDESGRIMASEVKDVGHTLATMQDLRDTEMATAIKSHGTGNAGAVSQRAVSVIRNRGLAEDTLDAPWQKEQPQNAMEGALRLTYLATQGILQAKHDPVQAAMLYSMINDDIRSLWKGYEMEPDSNSPTPKWKIKYEDGKPVQATPESWAKTFVDMHTALGLGGVINQQDVEQTAAALTGSDGKMINIEDLDAVKTYSSPLDVLAYHQADARDFLQEMAQSHRSLFEGPMSQLFAPEQIRRNIEAQEKGEPEKMKALQPADTRVIHDTMHTKDSAFQFEQETVVNMDKEVVGHKAVAAGQAHGFDPRVQAAVAGKDVSDDRSLVDVVPPTADPEATAEAIPSEAAPEAPVQGAVEASVAESQPVEAPSLDGASVAKTAGEAVPTVVGTSTVEPEHRNIGSREVPASFEAITEKADKEDQRKPTGMDL